MVLDRDERVLEMFRDFTERHVTPVLVEPEPSPAVRGEKPGVADAAGQTINRMTLAEEPRHAHRGEDDEDGEDGAGDAVAQRAVPADHVGRSARARRICSTSESTT